MKARIVQRTDVNGRVSYVIQQKHFLFRWVWVDAWINHGPECNDSFCSLESAKSNLCYFDGSVKQDVVVS